MNVKRIGMFVVLALVVAVGVVFAQATLSQQGRAIANLSIGRGYVINHPSLRVGINVIVANTVTGKEVLAIVGGRCLPLGEYVIAELSGAIWRDLELNSTTVIRITTVPN